MVSSLGASSVDVISLSASSSTDGFSLTPSNSVISSCLDTNICFELDFFFSPKNSSIVSSEALAVLVAVAVAVGMAGADDFSTRLAVPLAGFEGVDFEGVDFEGVAFEGVAFEGDGFEAVVLGMVGLVATFEVEDNG